MAGAHIDLPAHHDEGSVLFVHHTPDSLHRLVGLRCTDHRAMRLDDARLFARDLSDRVAKHLHVVQADRSDHRHDGCYHVHRVEPAAQAHLEHGDLYLLLLKIEEGDGGGNLVGGGYDRGVAQGLDALDDGGDLLGYAGHVIGRDHRAVHANALTESVQMGRGVEGCAMPCFAQDRVEHG